MSGYSEVILARFPPKYGPVSVEICQTRPIGSRYDPDLPHRASLAGFTVHDVGFESGGWGSGFGAGASRGSSGGIWGLGRGFSVWVSGLRI